MMTLFLIIAGVLVGLALILFVSAISVVWQDVKAARRLYATLPSRKYYRNYDQVYSHAYMETDDYFVWFTTRNAFQVGKLLYLHNESYTYWSIIGWYWLRKYQNWFKQNVNIETLPKY